MRRDVRVTTSTELDASPLRRNSPNNSSRPVTYAGGMVWWDSTLPLLALYFGWGGRPDFTIQKERRDEPSLRTRDSNTAALDHSHDVSMLKVDSSLGSPRRFCAVLELDLIFDWTWSLTRTLSLSLDFMDLRLDLDFMDWTWT